MSETDQAPAATPPRNGEHIRYLDGLRGIAILMVIAVHASTLTPGLPESLQNLSFYGVRGVQLFFIVSGLTLTITHIGRPLILSDFAARRFFRIAPMFYAGAALYLILGAMGETLFSPVDPRIGEVVATLTFTHGWFISCYNKIVPGGWSIAAEAMFYLAFPFLLAAALRGRTFLVVVIASYVVAGATNILLKKLLGPTPEIRGFAFSFWLCHLPAFVTGCWLASGPGYDRVSRTTAVFVMAGSVVGLVIDSQLRQSSNLLVAIVLLSLFVWSAGKVRPKWLSGRALPYIGQISFSLYILHFAVVAMLATVSPALLAALGPSATLPAIILLTLAIGGAAAALTYHFVEKPFIRLGRRWFAGPASKGSVG